MDEQNERNEKNDLKEVVPCVQKKESLGFRGGANGKGTVTEWTQGCVLVLCCVWQ